MARLTAVVGSPRWSVLCVIIASVAAGCSGDTPTAIPNENPCLLSVVIDGDSLRCADGREIRLLLIDAPEMGQAPWGEQARTALLGLSPLGSALEVEEYDVDRRDDFGRDLAYLYRSDGAMLNERMAWLGYAVALVIPPNGRHEARIRAAVSSAQTEERGLWADWKFACLPADFRAGRCS